MGYAKIPVTGKFLEARSRQGHSFHMNDSWVPIFRSLSYLVWSREELQAGTNTQTYIQANIRKRLATASRGFDYAYLWTDGKPFWGFYLEKRKVTTQQTFSN